MLGDDGYRAVVRLAFYIGEHDIVELPIWHDQSVLL
jgi:hypothetical protein